MTKTFKYELVGKKIRTTRKLKNLSQMKLSRLLEVTQATVSKYESGEIFPYMSKLKKLSEIFDVPISYLVDETISETKEKILSVQEKKHEIVSVIQEFWGEIGIHEKKKDVLHQPLMKFCQSRIREKVYTIPRQLKIITLLKLIEELDFPCSL